MKYYVAAQLKDWEKVQNLVNEMTRKGHRCTFNWAAASAPAAPELEPHTPDELRIRADMDLEAVTDADVVIVIPPGGRGTTGELTAGVVLKKPVLLWGVPDLKPTEGYACVFYWHSSLISVAGLPASTLATYLEQLVKNPKDTLRVLGY